MKRKLFTRRKLLKLGAGSIAAGCGTLGYTFFVEPFWLELVERKLPIANLPAGLRGRTLVQISDLHVSGRVSSDYLIESMQRVKELKPDIVVYTGDFISLDEETEVQMEKVFPHLPKGRIGTAAILGNHDYGVNFVEEEWAQRIIASLADQGIPVLRNEILELGGLQIIGMDDLWSGEFSAEKSLIRYEASMAGIVLSHNPDSVDEPGWGNYQGWVLAGHTHGGQCKPPFLPAPLLPVKNRRYSAGHIPLGDGRDLYINRALGYLHQVRFNVRPEVTFFEMT
ncbi:metallophosphoesterase [Luteolibacter sp. AS25]|uniref:metallophosphoesterase n=1 Tax=Luteolibacter sp. AS25 TaxID=3135776 RepID=UPI00398ACBF5